MCVNLLGDVLRFPVCIGGIQLRPECRLHQRYFSGNRQVIRMVVGIDMQEINGTERPTILREFCSKLRATLREKSLVLTAISIRRTSRRWPKRRDRRWEHRRENTFQLVIACRRLEWQGRVVFGLEHDSLAVFDRWTILIWYDRRRILLGLYLDDILSNDVARGQRFHGSSSLNWSRSVFEKNLSPSRERQTDHVVQEHVYWMNNVRRQHWLLPVYSWMHPTSGSLSNDS